MYVQLYEPQDKDAVTTGQLLGQWCSSLKDLAGHLEALLAKEASQSALEGAPEGAHEGPHAHGGESYSSNWGAICSS